MSNDLQALAHDRAAFLPPPGPGQTTVPGRGKRLKFLLTLPLFALAGGVVGAVVARTGMRFGELFPASVSLPLALLSTVLAFWPHIVLHEAGHALAGLSRGMRPYAFGIGRLRWERGLSGWRFRRGERVGGISGFAALLPDGDRGLSRPDQALYLLGGPLANLLVAVPALALLPQAGDSRVAASCLLGIAASGLLLGLVNLVPFHSQGWRSDGRGLLDLLRRSPDAALQQQVQQLLSLNMAGVRPRDWPEALVPPAETASSSPMLAANGALMRLSWAMDRGDDAAAAEVALRATGAFHAMPDAFRPHLAVALAGHAARNLRDHEVLAAWRPLCEGGLIDLSLVRAWLDAELAALSGNDPGTAVATARTLLDRAPDPVTALLLHEYLDDIAHGLPH